jgi:hypothetical protein
MSGLPPTKYAAPSQPPPNPQKQDFGEGLDATRYKREWHETSFEVFVGLTGGTLSHAS